MCHNSGITAGGETVFCVWGLDVHSTSQTSYRLITNWTVELRPRPAVIYFLRKFYENISLTLFILQTTSIEISSKTLPRIGFNDLWSCGWGLHCSAACLVSAGGRVSEGYRRRKYESSTLTQTSKNKFSLPQVIQKFPLQDITSVIDNFDWNLDLHTRG